jgi:hypothetical protein
MSKTFHICKWISFAISTSVIVEETPSIADKTGKVQEKYTLLDLESFFFPSSLGKIQVGLQWSLF